LLSRKTAGAWKELSGNLAALRKKHKRLGELHASHEQYITRKKVLSLIAEIKDLKILCVVLNKKKVYVDLQNQKNYLYNYAANI